MAPDATRGMLCAPIASLGPHEVATLDQVLSCAAIGSPETVREELADFVSRTGADELDRKSVV